MAKLSGDLTNLSAQTFVEQSSDPALPPDGKWRAFFKAKGLYIINHAGILKNLGAGADYILVREEQPDGSAGGTFTAGAWQARGVNRIVSDSGGHCALPGDNVIRLAAGTYEYEITCPAVSVQKHQARLYDVTADAGVADGEGSSEYAGGGTGNSSTIKGKFTIAAQNDFRIEHQCEITVEGFGFGFPYNGGQKEIYTTAVFRKVA